MKISYWARKTIALSQKNFDPKFCFNYCFASSILSAKNAILSKHATHDYFLRALGKRYPQLFKISVYGT